MENSVHPKTILFLRTRSKVLSIPLWVGAQFQRLVLEVWQNTSLLIGTLSGAFAYGLELTCDHRGFREYF